jgi:hypothetical protein
MTVWVGCHNYLQGGDGNFEHKTSSTEQHEVYAFTAVYESSGSDQEPKEVLTYVRRTVARLAMPSRSYHSPYVRVEDSSTVGCASLANSEKDIGGI